MLDFFVFWGPFSFEFVFLVFVSWFLAFSFELLVFEFLVLILKIQNWKLAWNFGNLPFFTFETFEKELKWRGKCLKALLLFFWGVFCFQL